MSVLMASTRFSEVFEGGLPYRRQEGQGNQCFKSLSVGYQNRQKNKQDKKSQGECPTSPELSKKWSLTPLKQGKPSEHKKIPIIKNETEGKHVSSITVLVLGAKSWCPFCAYS